MINAWLMDLCKQRGLVYFDYFSAMADEKGLLNAEIGKDGLHPNEMGYAIIKPLAKDAIKTALKPRK